MSKDIHDAALRLVEQRKNTHRSEVRLTGIDTLSEAYGVQAQTRLIMDASVAGWKASLQADGTLLSAPVFHCDTFNTGSVVPFHGRVDHGVECEVAFLIDTSLPPQPNHVFTRSNVAPHVSGVMPAFELLSCRLADAFRSAQAHLVADNLGNGGVVLGVPAYGWQDLSLAAIGITLSLDRQVILSKRCSHPLGDPFDVVVALANHLSERNLELRAGQFVIAGSYTPAQKVRPGSKTVASFDGFQPITLSIAAEDELASAPTK
ncbi:fumarylacetoacetate hydrolase family protein [Mesorhizobium sp.]|uniref:2-keto-4-pentenoate hydratase n=1 Tax=Mesorhizobium sp. TaxID=1871066 RepID=UPI00121F772B|nr:fumarylacetoacetate hydrolase family protein [Mesorhizobium sp.]TIU42720.1 MAG: hypothetical protein E5W26_00250 [Mesorhizobium sp.]TIV62394.1 MAG: hypothetical protein E5V80_00595 [Mesorhizobium sp.]